VRSKLRAGHEALASALMSTARRQSGPCPLRRASPAEFGRRAWHRSSDGVSSLASMSRRAAAKSRMMRRQYARYWLWELLCRGKRASRVSGLEEFAFQGEPLGLAFFLRVMSMAETLENRKFAWRRTRGRARAPTSPRRPRADAILDLVSRWRLSRLARGGAARAAVRRVGVKSPRARVRREIMSAGQR